MTPHEFSVATVREAGILLKEMQKEGFDTAYKGGNPKDIVTTADTALNDLITSKIKATFPEDGIYSEEATESESANTRRWTIDPIDGSANFSRGIPHFAICLGLLEDGVPTVGAIYNPATDELFSFERGRGAFLNGSPIRVSGTTDLSAAFVLLHAGRKPEVAGWGGESYRRLLGAVRKTGNLGSSALDACFVASGRVEANIYGTLGTLDIAPALGLLTEAGGVLCGAAGEEVILTTESRRVYMANSPAMLEAVRTLLESV